MYEIHDETVTAAPLDDLKVGRLMERCGVVLHVVYDDLDAAGC